MYISEVQKRLMNIITDENRDAVIELAVKNGANKNELSDAYHIALWFEGAPKKVKESLLDFYFEDHRYGEVGLRICSHCGKYMTEGYIFGDYSYACDEPCAIELYREDYRKRTGLNQAPADARRDFDYDLEKYPDENFWTDWEQY